MSIRTPNDLSLFAAATALHAMSVLPPKADIRGRGQNVRQVPEADIAFPSSRRRDRNSACLCRPPISGDKADVMWALLSPRPSRALEAAEATRCLRICGARRHASRDEVLDLVHRVEGLVLCGFGRQTRSVRSSDHVGAARQRERGHWSCARPTSRAAPEMRLSSSARASAASSTRLPRDKFMK